MLEDEVDMFFNVGPSLYAWGWSGHVFECGPLPLHSRVRWTCFSMWAPPSTLEGEVDTFLNVGPSRYTWGWSGHVFECGPLPLHSTGMHFASTWYHSGDVFPGLPNFKSLFCPCIVCKSENKTRGGLRTRISLAYALQIKLMMMRIVIAPLASTYNKTCFMACIPHSRANFPKESGHETMYTYNGTMDVHKCFGPCSWSCFWVQIYCSMILLPNTFTFISPGARNVTLHKDDDTVQQQQLLWPLPQCTNLNHHHFLLLTKVCFDDKYFTDTILPVLEVLLLEHYLEIYHNHVWNTAPPRMKNIMDAIFQEFPLHIVS